MVIFVNNVFQIKAICHFNVHFTPNNSEEMVLEMILNICYYI